MFIDYRIVYVAWLVRKNGIYGVSRDVGDEFEVVVEVLAAKL